MTVESPASAVEHQLNVKMGTSMPLTWSIRRDERQRQTTNKPAANLDLEVYTRKVHTVLSD